MTVDSLQIPPEKIESQHKRLDILHTSFALIVLPINEALLDSTKIIGHTLSTIPSTCKRVDKKYYILSKDLKFLFLHSSPNSLLVNAVNVCGRQSINHWRRCSLQSLVYVPISCLMGVESAARMTDPSTGGAQPHTSNILNPSSRFLPPLIVIKKLNPIHLAMPLSML